jgi:predicted ATPase/class 3 adenylate cyclase
MRDLPTGTVTFLFTDVEGSTRLLHDLGADRYAVALAEHRRAIREACGRHGGVEVDTQGDAFFFAFATAPAALAAAEDAVEALERGPIRVRAGLHTGTPVVTHEGYVGDDVHRAARIAAAGHGGQILVSSVTAGLLDVDSLVDLGEHRFKDLAAPERVYQLGDGDFPPLSSLHRTNLPTPPTPFLGRERELGEVVARLRREELRLVTLTGPGGTGKTRLALQAAAEAAESFPDGLWWVPLAQLREARLLTSALAQALQVEAQPGRELGAILVQRLTGMRALLLLDNAEHLIPEIAGEVVRLRDAGGPTILVTSRERLQLQGEHVFAVPALAGDEGVALFLTRARALGTDLPRAPAVVELCARLDNLPLALELAAARTVAFPPEQLLERLSERLDLLRAGRDADPRQQTLRATIEWSYELLDEHERRLFRGFSVFAGGCAYEAAEEVCGAGPDTLQSLLDKSLLRRVQGPVGPRYLMLETIRELAAEKLSEQGESDGLRRRHAVHYLALARSANLDVESQGEQRHELVAPERDNVRAALAWALEEDERELGLELVVALENHWATSGPQEGAAWVAAMLEGDPGVPDQLVARALRVQGGQENFFAEAGVAEGRWEEALAICRRIGDERGVAILLQRLAHAAVRRGDLPRARALAEESRDGFRRVGHRRGEVYVAWNLAEIARAEGDLDGALELLHESRRASEETGFQWWLAGMHANIGAVSLELGRIEDARRSAREALALSRLMHDRKALVYELGLLAEIEAKAGDTRHAGTLWGAAEAESERTWTGRWLHGTVEPERVLALADDEFQLGRAEGRELELDTAVAVALGDEGAEAVTRVR